MNRQTSPGLPLPSRPPLPAASIPALTTESALLEAYRVTDSALLYFADGFIAASCHARSMPTFDIFHEFPHGSAMWVVSVPALPDARTHMDMMAWQKPGKYFVCYRGERVADIDTTSRLRRPVN